PPQGSCLRSAARVAARASPPSKDTTTTESTIGDSMATEDSGCGPVLAVSFTITQWPPSAISSAYTQSCRRDREHLWQVCFPELPLAVEGTAFTRGSDAE